MVFSVKKYLDKTECTYYLIVSFILVVLLKVAFLIFLNGYGGPVFDGGMDSNFYHNYAVSNEARSVPNIWPSILRLLNDAGLYGREPLSYVLQFIGIIVIPLLVAKISLTSSRRRDINISLLLAIFVSFYPVLFYYSLDIYRDVFMVFMFLLALFFLRELSITKMGLYKIFLYVLSLSIAYFLFLLRPYLGFAFAASLVFSGVYSFKLYPLVLSFLGLLLILNVMYALGLLEEILDYRAMFTEGLISGGSNFGITFASGFSFVPDLLLSTAFQMFGLFFVNVSSTILFIFETIPFTAALIYLIRNRRFSNYFVDSLVIFFIAYGVIWLLGNDNLGAGVRLRVFNYLVIYIACTIVYQNKCNFYRHREVS